ncbi:MAG: DUF853 family protein [Lachnospiraceae bacterium]|nr:DUF853 family protein [Lachnospiraceae bacterium]
MLKDGKIWIANSDKELYLLPKMANRHGLIAGATGTGKTTTMKVLAESFSDLGVPVFLCDVKGDVSGLLSPGQDSENMQERIRRFGIEDFSYKGYPVHFFDIFGEEGHPARITVSSMGPQLLSRLFHLTEVQSGVLSIVFRVADDNGLLLLDLKDLQAMLKYVGDNRAEFTTLYGNVSAASIGAIQRALLAFEDEGGVNIFGEPELDIRDFIRTDYDGRGYINVLSSRRLVNSPTVYATFLLYLMTELFEKLPEIGDPEKPRLVFFFDEAHFLFTDTPKTLVQKITQVVRLIRSKGVGIYFVTQSPADIPDEVLAQLSNRIQHGLRAYTPSEQKAVRAAARAFRVNPSFDTEERLMALGTGEALVSFLDEKGIPGVAEDAKILPPQSFMGPAEAERMQQAILTSELELKYRETIDRESAYELIMEANRILEEEQQRAAEEAATEKQRLKEEAEAEKQRLKEEAAARKAAEKKNDAVKKTAQRATTAATSTVVSALSHNLVNSVTGGRKTSAATIAKRAASNALSSVMRAGSSAIIRGLFENRK